MEELFPRMIDSFCDAASKIENELSKVFASDRKSLTEEQWTEYGDNLESLQYRLKQLNTILHFEYQFEENLANDILNYSKLLNESRQPCEELIGFLLTRDHDEWTRDETAFLKEVLNGIIDRSDRINTLLG
jgi:hypothetical protein